MVTYLLIFIHWHRSIRNQLWKLLLVVSYSVVVSQLWKHMTRSITFSLNLLEVLTISGIGQDMILYQLSLPEIYFTIL